MEELTNDQVAAVFTCATPQGQVDALEMLRSEYWQAGAETYEQGPSIWSDNEAFAGRRMERELEQYQRVMKACDRLVDAITDVYRDTNEAIEPREETF